LCIAAVVGLPALLEQYGVADSLDHGSDALGPGSQIPERSAALCEELPNDVDFIPELRSGWAVTESDGKRVSLVFSDAALGCIADPALAIQELSSHCVEAWSYTLTVPTEILKPGKYDLADYSVGFTQASSFSDRGAGCQSECDHGMVGGGTAPGARIEATLEVFSVSDECITGRIRGLESGQISPPPPEWNGGFHAVRCEPE